VRQKPVFPPPLSPATNRPKRNKGRQPRTTLTINGRITVLRVRWHCPADGPETPLDAVLDAAEATVSRGVVEIACRLNQGSISFDHTADMLLRAAHIRSNKETLRQLIEAAGRDALQAMQKADLLPSWSVKDCLAPAHAAADSVPTDGGSDSTVSRLYLGCDGVSVPLVTGDEKRKRRKGVRKKRQRSGRKCKPLPRMKPGADNAYKEFKVARIYDQSMKHRLVGVTAGNCEAAGRMMKRMELQTGMAEADERIAIFDGAPWIRNQIEFHSLAEHPCLDFYHLQDYAQKTRRIVFGEDLQPGKDWLQTTMHTFKHEG